MNDLRWSIAILFGILLLYLAAERMLAVRCRRRLSHVVYVNGTRGKSSVVRLIEAGLRAGGIATLAKTTGTLPIWIDPAGREHEIRRLGAANIREQLWMLLKAARLGAKVLVIECMAIDPELMRVSAERMLGVDVAVITNARLDHTDVMGDSTRAVCDALLHITPKNGVLFTADCEHFPRMQRYAAARNTEACLTSPDESLSDIDFPENVSLALAVCGRLGVPQDVAVTGMRNFLRDPFAMTVHRLGETVFVDGMSVNDPQSIVLALESARRRFGLQALPLTLLINARADRPARTQQMAELVLTLRPERVLLLGDQQPFLRRRIRGRTPGLAVASYRRAADVPLTFPEPTLLYAVGNIKDEGRKLSERVGREGTACTTKSSS